MWTIDLELTPEDESTIHQYKVDVERARGYNGPCFVCVDRLAEIHMETCEALVQVALFRIKHQSKQAE